MIAGLISVASFLVFIISIKTSAGVDVGSHLLHLPFLIVLLIESCLAMGRLEWIESVLSAAIFFVSCILIECNGIDAGFLPAISITPNFGGHGIAITIPAVRGESFAVAEEFVEVVSHVHVSFCWLLDVSLTHARTRA